MHEQPANRVGPETASLVFVAVHAVGDPDRLRALALVGGLRSILEDQDGASRSGDTLARRAEMAG